MSDRKVFERQAQAKRAVLVAPAGCGKTHAIAQAVAMTSSKPQLILTHTHAGVAALRRRLHALGVAKSQYTIETIAGWSLKLATSYPMTSGLITGAPETDEEWSRLNPAAESVSKLPAIQKVLTNSFGGIFVDEYQDCTVPQHRFIMSLAEILPCRILGDPLQSIFGFAGESVDWDRDILANFEKLPELETPWRWSGENEQLGKWLTIVRRELLAKRAISLERAPVIWKHISIEEQRRVCYEHLGIHRESVVALLQWPAECHKMACVLGGKYKSMEAIECPDLLKYAKLIQARTGAERVLSCVSFAKIWMRNLSKSTTTLERALKSGRMPRDTGQKHGKLYAAVAGIIDSNSIARVKDLLVQLRYCPETNVYREELWSEMLRSVEFAKNSDDPDLGRAAWAVRNITRTIGRQERLRLISRTVLVKGLEYDHVLLLNADTMDLRNLYVGLTRARKSITVLSELPMLGPFKEENAA
ncbi:MAG: AAA family ATPase [bacterium]|nr:AAA family ATPase [bacterium]